jgi:hypothetical protein
MDPRETRVLLERLSVVLGDSAALLDDTAVLLVSLDVRLAMLRDAIIQHRATVGDEAGAADFRLWDVLDDDLARRDRWGLMMGVDDGA